MNDLNVTLAGNLSNIFIVIGIIFAVMLGFIVKLHFDLSRMKERYLKMTAGADNANFQQILVANADKISAAVESVEKLQGEVNRIDGLTKRALTRVAVVRFNAFHDDTAELSYSIAILDEENSGVIISSLNGREFTRNYVKPIVKGESVQYKLTREEQQAIDDAAIPPEERTGG